MTTEYEARLICDKCGETIRWNGIQKNGLIKGVPGKDLMRAVAQEEGWTFKGQADYCKTCSETEEEKP